MKISKKKMRFFLMSQGSFNPKIRFLGQKVCPVARPQTDRQTHTRTKVITEGTLSGFQDFFLQPIIKDRPKKSIRRDFKTRAVMRNKLLTWNGLIMITGDSGS